MRENRLRAPRNPASPSCISCQRRMAEEWTDATFPHVLAEELVCQLAPPEESVTFEQLRAKGLVGRRGPAPKPEVMDIANELARTELKGTKITDQSIKGIAARLGDQFANSGGFR